MKEDESQLNALAVAHYVVGAFLVLFGCFPLIHAFFGLAMISGVGGVRESMESSGGGPPPEWFGWLFFLIGLGGFVVAQAIAIGVIVSGRFLKQRRNYLFSFVLACVACLFVPIGTILGVFTIIVLSRDSVKALYGR